MLLPQCFCPSVVYFNRGFAHKIMNSKRITNWFQVFQNCFEYRQTILFLIFWITTYLNLNSSIECFETMCRMIQSRGGLGGMCSGRMVYTV